VTTERAPHTLGRPQTARSDQQPEIDNELGLERLACCAGIAPLRDGRARVRAATAEAQHPDLASGE